MPKKKTKQQKEYEQVIQMLNKETETYLENRFEHCHPEAEQISRLYKDQIWDDAMKIMQDFPSKYTQTAAVCFFAFMGLVIDSHLELRFDKQIDRKDIPVLIPDLKLADSVKSFISEANIKLNKVGQELVTKLLERDYGLLFGILKAIRIENSALHNLLVSGFRMYVWEIMLPHLFNSEKKEETNENSK